MKSFDIEETLQVERVGEAIASLHAGPPGSQLFVGIMTPYGETRATFRQAENLLEALDAVVNTWESEDQDGFVGYSTEDIEVHVHPEAQTYIITSRDRASGRLELWSDQWAKDLHSILSDHLSTKGLI